MLLIFQHFAEKLIKLLVPAVGIIVIQTEGRLVVCVIVKSDIVFFTQAYSPR